MHTTKSLNNPIKSWHTPTNSPALKLQHISGAALTLSSHHQGSDSISTNKVIPHSTKLQTNTTQRPLWATNPTQRGFSSLQQWIILGLQRNTHCFEWSYPSPRLPGWVCRIAEGEREKISLWDEILKCYWRRNNKKTNRFLCFLNQISVVQK